MLYPKTKKRVLIGIISCHDYTTRREACRSSWLRFLPESNMTAFFLIGSPVYSPKLRGDVLHMPCNDAYDDLPQKIYWLARWALENNFDSLFKCDDDTFVHIPRLMPVIKTASDYVGCRIERHSTAFASGGAGYLLSKKSMSCIVQNDALAITKGIEDLIVGRTLLNNNIAVQHDNRFCPWDHYPEPHNDKITGHYVNPTKMIELYNQNAPACFHAGALNQKVGGVNVWDGPPVPSACCNSHGQIHE